MGDSLASGSWRGSADVSHGVKTVLEKQPPPISQSPRGQAQGGRVPTIIAVALGSLAGREGPVASVYPSDGVSGNLLDSCSRIPRTENKGDPGHGNPREPPPWLPPFPSLCPSSPLGAALPWPLRKVREAAGQPGGGHAGPPAVGASEVPQCEHSCCQGGRDTGWDLGGDLDSSASGLSHTAAGHLVPAPVSMPAGWDGLTPAPHSCLALFPKPMAGSSPGLC